MDHIESRKHDEERQQQIAAGRQLAAAEVVGQSRRVLHVAKPAAQPPKKNTLKGHEAFLKALEMNGADVVLEKISSGNIYYGKLRHSDKFTVTLYVTEIQYGTEGDRVQVKGCERVIFKNDISEFYTTTPPAARRAEAA